MNDVFYRPQGQEIPVFEAAMNLGLPLLLKGPTGCGKTRFVEYMAAKTGRKLITVSCHEETSATDLVGRHFLKGQEAAFQDGPLTRAMREGAILYLDEIAEARPDILVVLHSVTDYRRELFIERTLETLKAPPSFQLVASFNPGYQKGMKELKPSTRQRFLSLNFTYPDEAEEARILAHESSLSEDLCLKLARLGQKIRHLQELGLMETVSTRLLVETARLIQADIPIPKAIEVALIEPLTDEDEDREALKDLASMHF